MDSEIRSSRRTSSSLFFGTNRLQTERSELTKTNRLHIVKIFNIFNGGAKLTFLAKLACFLGIFYQNMKE